MCFVCRRSPNILSCFVFIMATVAAALYKKKCKLSLFRTCICVSRLCFWRTRQEGGLPLLLCLAQAPPRAPSSADGFIAAPSSSSSSSTSFAVAAAVGGGGGGGVSTAVGTGGWEVFASAVRLLRRSCMVSANRSDLLALKVSSACGRCVCGMGGVLVIAYAMP